VALLVVLQFVLHEGISDAYDIATDTGVYAFSAPVIGHIVELQCKLSYRSRLVQAEARLHIGQFSMTISP
jgi:hypothetical protein